MEGVINIVLCGICHDMTYDTILCGIVSYGKVLYGMVWYGKVW